ncbi:MAG: hypothetical protein ACOX4N_07360 [Dethiobacteraceae bacterium]
MGATTFGGGYAMLAYY